MKTNRKTIIEGLVKKVKFGPGPVFGYDLKKTTRIIEKIIKTTEKIETTELRPKPAKTPQEQGWSALPTFIMRAPSLPGGFKEYVGILLSFANHERKAWPSQDTIQASTSKKKRTITSYNRILRDKFNVKIFQRGFNRSNLFIFPKWWPLPKKLASKNDARQQKGTIPGSNQLRPYLDYKELDTSEEENNLKMSFYETARYRELIKLLGTIPTIKNPNAYLNAIIQKYGVKMVRRLSSVEFGRWQDNLDYWKSKRGNFV